MPRCECAWNTGKARQAIRLPRFLDCEKSDYALTFLLRRYATEASPARSINRIIPQPSIAGTATGGSCCAAPSGSTMSLSTTVSSPGCPSWRCSVTLLPLTVTLLKVYHVVEESPRIFGPYFR
jgi:hypothetical protein